MNYRMIAYLSGMIILILAAFLLLPGLVGSIVLLAAFALVAWDIALGAVKNIRRGDVFGENFLMTIAHIQSKFSDRESVPIRTALVTSRGAPAHERAIKTLRQWGVRVDEAHFLGGVSKREILRAFGAHIFFDDQPAHAEPASKFVPSAVVPYAAGQDPMT